MITSRISSSQKYLDLIRPGDFAPHIPEIYTLNLRMFTSLFSVLPSSYTEPTDKAVGPIFALNTSYDVVLRKEVPFGGEKN